MKAPEQNSSNPQDEGIQAPRLAEALRKEAAAHRIFIPPVLDEAILAKARAHFTGPEPRRAAPRFWSRFGLLLAGGAAVVVILLGIVQFQKPLTSAKSDINGDGEIDILDAMALAKLIESGKPIEPRFDLNGDNRVDRSDQRIVEEAAVRLPF